MLIILLVCQIGSALRNGDTFVIDFSKQEAKEQVQKEMNLKEEVAEKINQMLESSAGAPVRNLAVDRGTLKDDRNTNAEELYKDAEKLDKELKSGFKVEEDDEDYVAVNKPQPKKEEASSKDAYKGPSVVSYELEGRKASRLSIPAYRCLGAGYVTVIITVDPQGSVISAKIQEDVSSDDKCLRDFAIRAAKLSRFSASTSAPARQVGNIVYMFIAQ